MHPNFLTLDDVTAIHTDQIERYGGSHGIRDMALLQSAVAMPQAMFGDQYLHHDLVVMAAAYLFHIVQNHAFIDGNKRAGVVSALVFLEINGLVVRVTHKALVMLVRDVAQGKTGKEEIADFFRKSVAKPPSV